MHLVPPQALLVLNISDLQNPTVVHVRKMINQEIVNNPNLQKLVISNGNVEGGNIKPIVDHAVMIIAAAEGIIVVVIITIIPVIRGVEKNQVDKEEGFEHFLILF